MAIFWVSILDFWGVSQKRSQPFPCLALFPVGNKLELDSLPSVSAAGLHAAGHVWFSVFPAARDLNQEKNCRDMAKKDAKLIQAVTPLDPPNVGR